MKTSRTNDIPRLGAYSAAAGAVLSLSVPAAAGVIIIDTNVTVNSGNPLYEIDLNEDGTNDCYFLWSGDSSTRYGSGAGTNGAELCTSGGNARRFTTGQTISSAAGSWSLAGPLFSFSVSSSSFTNGYFSNSDTGYVGVRFPVDGGNHTNYGWVYVSLVGANGNRFKITEYGYGDEGEPVYAGLIPEPGTGLATLALGAAGVAARRRGK